MGEAIKAVLCGLLNIYNDGENSGKGCGCLTVVALVVGALIISAVAQSDLPYGGKLFFLGIVVLLGLYALGWMLYQTYKQWREEKAKGETDSSGFIPLAITVALFIIFLLYCILA